MTTLRISLDLDGTIFEWDSHYNSKFGIPKTDLEITKNVTGILRRDKEFWMTQPLINIPDFIPACYCTARVIKKDWIKQQIRNNSLPIAPVYQVHGVALSKYAQIKRAAVNVHIDDSLKVFIDLNSRGIPCLLLDSPKNQSWGHVGRIKTLNYKEIEKVYYKFTKNEFTYFKELVC